MAKGLHYPDDLNSSDIYIDVPQDKYSVYAPVISIIISNFLQAFMRRRRLIEKKLYRFFFFWMRLYSLKYHSRYLIQQCQHSVKEGNTIPSDAVNCSA